MTVYNADPIYFGGVSAVTATPGSNDPEVGTRRRVGDEDYIYGYNVGSSTAGQTYGVTLSGVTGYSFTVSSTTSADCFVGVVKHADIATGSYGWLLTKGFATVEMGADNSAPVGGMLTVGEDGTFAWKSSATGYLSPIVGKAMSAMASGASGAAFINIF